MSFTYNNFLRPLAISDTTIHILDDSGVVVYTINPFSVSSTMVSNNLLKVNFKNSNIITINFSSNNEAKLALSRLQAQLDEFIKRTPLIIDKQIKNYIDGRVVANPTASSLGTAGNKLGDISFSLDYLYYCVGDYDGVNNIWKRVAWSNDTW
jgi:hypothetical protein